MKIGKAVRDTGVVLQSAMAALQPHMAIDNAGVFLS